MISIIRTRNIRRHSKLQLLATLLLALGSSEVSYAADMIKGGNLYAAHCAACHGASGVSVMPGAPSFARSERLLQPDMALLATIKSGKKIMPAFQGVLSDRDILDVIAYLRTLN
ncbi:MAG: cytochrome c [Hydrogenophilales bacterium]|nr:cytochrome c [Hydrogenophilales bacterium]